MVAEALLKAYPTTVIAITTISGGPGGRAVIGAGNLPKKETYSLSHWALKRQNIWRRNIIFCQTTQNDEICILRKIGKFDISPPKM